MPPCVFALTGYEQMCRGEQRWPAGVRGRHQQMVVSAGLPVERGGHSYRARRRFYDEGSLGGGVYFRE